MLAKFLAVEEAISIAPHSTAEVKLQDADLSNVGFIFPTTETAARGLLLANAGLLLGPAKAFVYNSKDVTQNLSRGDCIAMNVALEGEGLKAGAIETPSASEPAETEEVENTEAPTESAEEEAPVNPDEITDPMEENDSSEAESETEESPEEKEEEEVVEETPKKSTRKSSK